MKIYSFIDEFSSLFPCILTIGIFDGVHMGHKKIIQNLILSAEKKYCPVLITFHPHPKEILNPGKKFFYLNTISERIYNLKKIGIEHLIVHPFSINFSKLSTKKFLNKILHSQFRIKQIITGHDSHIGKNRDGSYEELKKLSHIYGFKLYQVEAYKLNKRIVSSTDIRKSLLLGNIQWANQALGYLYTLSGNVIKGKGIGKTIQFPTANLQIDSKKLIPKNGVYAVKINYLDNIYQGMLNIGFNPTIDQQNQKINVEVHIFNFFENIYGKKIEISIIHMIREEKKFNTLQELKKQIEKDEINIKKFFSCENKN
ncbi:bifunctional riboflavin kinase/FAD synthetase [Blattabacterium sp. (Blattella germanica) str. Bge]|uniref:bifunctional riboflavin kinase/FAD synthetase n=1 Tax=Blattabacterium sp. (Blattella germanica) TaxID=624186 RepID=UPI0001BB62E9|nr:bifunctional riboflavin kinase/FAD synthetase [Blattabacterium sp. (Blattella germanica)]ACY40105.1 bifunctional riboflavin kinase/FAD synthetase [Blattabacterium sp. (Blattella germanica) str. Bge]